MNSYYLSIMFVCLLRSFNFLLSLSLFAHAQYSETERNPVHKNLHPGFLSFQAEDSVHLGRFLGVLAGWSENPDEVGHRVMCFYISAESQC